MSVLAKCIDGDEVDAFRKRYWNSSWRRGERTRIKRKFNRRVRATARRELRCGEAG